MTTLTNPGEERYVNLVTFRRDGREVRTPVWIAPGDGYFYVFSASNAGKVKRIRANKNVRFAGCDVRGEIIGPWFEGHARVLAESDRNRALQALHRKYGWLMTISDVFAKLSGRFRKRAYIEIKLVWPPTTLVIGRL
jgi:PPOX class probable F420-dependent enzyme